MPRSLEIQVQEEPGVVVICPRGRIDSSQVEYLKQEFTDRVNAGQQNMVVDFAGTLFLASSVLPRAPGLPQAHRPDRRPPGRLQSETAHQRSVPRGRLRQVAQGCRQPRKGARAGDASEPERHSSDSCGFAREAGCGGCWHVSGVRAPSGSRPSSRRPRALPAASGAASRPPGGCSGASSDSFAVSMRSTSFVPASGRSSFGRSAFRHFHLSSGPPGLQTRNRASGRSSGES